MSVRLVIILICGATIITQLQTLAADPPLTQLAAQLVVAGQPGHWPGTSDNTDVEQMYEWGEVRGGAPSTFGHFDQN